MPQVAAAPPGPPEGQMSEPRAIIQMLAPSHRAQMISLIPRAIANRVTSGVSGSKVIMRERERNVTHIKPERLMM